eukprot:319839_1
MAHNVLHSEELDIIDQYLHVITLSLMGLLLLISSYEMCISSINDQPRIKYRFITMLYCFVEFFVFLMATTYFLVDPSNLKWRHSIALFIRLCQMTGRILGALCAYSFLLTIVKSLYCTPQYRQPLPQWFIIFTQIFCALIMIIDIIQTIISFVIGTTYIQNLFMFILSAWMLLFSIAVIIALCGAKKQIRLQLQRAEGPYMNSVISAQEHEQHNRFNPSSSKFDIRHMNIPKTVNVMDVDAKSMRSLHDNEHYKALKARMMRINLLMIFNILTFVMLIAGGWYIYQKELYRIMSNQTFP